MIGDSTDVFGRLKRLLPGRWFGSKADSVPILDAVMTGIASALSFLYSLYAYAKLQTRIRTATDGWLDLIATDFFGLTIRRKANQTDDSFRTTILINLFREKATRAAIERVCVDLTGNEPLIVEPTRAADTGAYGVGMLAYGQAGAYGSLLLPYQAFVKVYRAVSFTGLANVSGYNMAAGGYGMAAAIEWANLSLMQGSLADADIFAAIDAVKAAGTIVWVQITSAP